jgi:hypothetical protein
MQKVHCHFKTKFQLIVNIKFQNYFKLKSSFSPFLYSTCSLSIINFYQVLRVVPQYSKKITHTSFYYHKNIYYSTGL